VFVRFLNGERSPDADGDTCGCTFFMFKNCDLKMSNIEIKGEKYIISVINI
jgi:hypothetical protein